MTLCTSIPKEEKKANISPFTFVPKEGKISPSTSISKEEKKLTLVRLLLYVRKKES